MSSKEISQLLARRQLHFENVWWLPAMSNRIPDDFWENLIEMGEEDDNKVLREAGFDMKAVFRQQEGKDSDVGQEEFAEWYVARNDDRDPQPLEGFIVQARMPVPESPYPDESEPGEFCHGTYSPGYTIGKTFYGKTLEDIVEKALVWRRELCASQHEKNTRPKKPLDEGGEEE